ncbi:hypothetical protein [Cellulophaga sp. Z1A5H]|uniref:hypothetical protein n=1 Tax=Cellulophaga sp. Z1A5H TaxID=2687291 RepID=UPI00196AC88C|nr:hypothetical protein [Cellulophaga sp. Z1A5H]
MNHSYHINYVGFTNFMFVINNGDLNNARLTLNCKGWQIKDATKGLEFLKTKAKDELFLLVANN